MPQFGQALVQVSLCRFCCDLIGRSEGRQHLHHQEKKMTTNFFGNQTESSSQGNQEGPEGGHKETYVGMADWIWNYWPLWHPTVPVTWSITSVVMGHATVWMPTDLFMEAIITRRSDDTQTNLWLFISTHSFTCWYLHVMHSAGKWPLFLGRCRQHALLHMFICRIYQLFFLFLFAFLRPPLIPPLNF